MTEDYTRLGLRLGRHIDGLVDSYYGPAELQQEVGYGVRPQRTPEAEFEQAHAALARALPGKGSVAERYQAWPEKNPVLAEQLPPAAGLDVPMVPNLVTELIADELTATGCAGDWVAGDPAKFKRLLTASCRRPSCSDSLSSDRDGGRHRARVPPLHQRRGDGTRRRRAP